jgi:hypothetical protein
MNVEIGIEDTIPFPGIIKWYFRCSVYKIVERFLAIENILEIQ